VFCDTVIYNITYITSRQFYWQLWSLRKDRWKREVRFA